MKREKGEVKKKEERKREGEMKREKGREGERKMKKEKGREGERKMKKELARRAGIYAARKADFGCPLDDGEVGYDPRLPVDAPAAPLKACRRALYFLRFLGLFEFFT